MLAADQKTLKGKMKKYKVHIEWETEVEASSVEEAIEKGSDDWFFDYNHKNFIAEENES